MSQSGDPEEAADVLLLLLHYAHKRGFSLAKWARCKFEVVKKRKWKKPDKAGVIEHVKGSQFDKRLPTIPNAMSKP